MAIQNILLIQPIFAPTDEQANRNIRSLRSIGDYFKSNGTDGVNLMIVMGGWAQTDDLWNRIVESGKEILGTNFNPVRFDKNYGKAFIVNNLYKNAIDNGVNAQALLTMDSDIVFPLTTPHILTRLSVAAEKMVELKRQPWGLIGLNQLEHGCHFKSCYENQSEYTVTIRNIPYVEKIVWPTITSGIAGGCLFINREYWDKVGGYDISKSKVYGPDDAYLLNYCHPAGYSWQMADTIGIIHPFDNNTEYANWKVNTCQRVARNPGEKYEDTIEEAQNFWKNK